MFLIDKLGRKPLLIFGMAGIAVTMFILSYGFQSATYTLTPESIDTLEETINKDALTVRMSGVEYTNDILFKHAIAGAIGSVRQPLRTNRPLLQLPLI